MEVEDPEHRVLFLEEAATKDACAEESAPGIVPDGENVFCDGYSLVWGGGPPYTYADIQRIFIYLICSICEFIFICSEYVNVC